MARHMSRHSGVSCDACGKGGFSGKRFKCLLCYDFDLCADCHEAGETGSGRHITTHPMQCILTRVDADLFYGGESHGVEKTPLSYTCPLCAQLGFSEAQLRDHVTKHHAESGGGQEVICPVCASHPSGDPNHLTDDFPSHLTMEHRPPPRDYDLVHEQSTVQSRVRRLIGRRRGGGLGDRYVGVFQREANQSQDSVDPITELLSQLSGTGSGGGGGGSGGGGGGGSGGGSGGGWTAGGGGGGGRRLFSDMPAHVQHLLEERQHFERASPSRRPVYRKIVCGMQGSANSSMAYHLPGQHPVLPPHPLLDMGVGLDLSRGHTSTVSRDSHKERSDAASSGKDYHLLASYSLPPLSEEEKSSLEQTRADKSLFVQELLLSMLAYSDSSDSSSSEEGT